MELDQKVTNHFSAFRAKLNVFSQEHVDSIVVKVEGPFRSEHYRFPAVKFSRESEVDGSTGQEHAEECKSCHSRVPPAASFSWHTAQGLSELCGALLCGASSASAGLFYGARCW